MPKPNIRFSALTWFHSKFPQVSDAVFTSKCYTREESWSKTRVWFFQIPLSYIEPNQHPRIHLILENHLEGSPFIYLKVPTLFLLQQQKNFEVDTKEKVIRLYLSAEAADKYKEVRKGSKIDFSSFIREA